jgi:hypothetical protein
VYRVVTDDQIKRQLDLLPQTALAALAELRVLLEVDPWVGEPVNPTNPDGAVRMTLFGADQSGIAVYLILENQRRVDLVQVAWLD